MNAPINDENIVTISLPTPFPVGPVNVFLVKGDPLILVDTGLRSEESYALLTAALGEHGVGIGDLDAILVTHGHRDHMGLLGRILAESDAEAYAHPRVSDEGQDSDAGGAARKQFYINIMTEFGVPDEVIEEANSLYERFRAFSEPYTIAHTVNDLDVALGYRVYHVPGHSPSDTLFVREADGVSFTGDHILVGSNPNPLLRRTRPGEAREKSLVEYQASLRRTRELELGVCYPGHGEPIADHVAVVDRILGRQEKRSEQVMKLVREGKDTPYAVSRGLFPDLPTNALHLGLSIAVGHLEVLEERGVLASRHDAGVLRFQ